jgi:hypothetical protein
MGVRVLQLKRAVLGITAIWQSARNLLGELLQLSLMKSVRLVEASKSVIQK